ncbi:MAG: carbohydrate ABC transporter permease [Spirochaetales bacterium]|nr:carbohydrate ABC transporter permease [Spirochaetales bacterium]
MKTKKNNWIITLFIFMGSLFILFPLYLSITTALKTPQELAESRLAFPTGLHFENFITAIEITNFFNALKNCFIITVSAVSITILTNSMVAYAIARNMHKKFYKGLYFYLISAMFIPFPIIMLPIVKQTHTMGMDNPIGIIFLYIVYGLAFNIFVYVGYIKSIPLSLEEAAVIDGASTWVVFWKVIFPLLGPMNATIGILSSLWIWNDFMLPLIILTKRRMMTLPLVQFVFQSQFSTDYNLAFASYLMALLPMIIVFILAQKWIISGVMKGGIK